MPLPPPPGAAAKVSQPAVVATGTVTPAATDATKADKVKGAGFGIGRGDGKIAVPVINGVDSAKVVDALYACLAANGVTDVAATIEAFKATPKSLFPGNKEGRACYSLGSIINALNKTHTSLHKVRAVGGERKQRVKQSDVFKGLLSKLSAALGGDSKITEILGADAAKFLA